MTRNNRKREQQTRIQLQWEKLLMPLPVVTVIQLLPIQTGGCLARPKAVTSHIYKNVIIISFEMKIEVLCLRLIWLWRVFCQPATELHIWLPFVECRAAWYTEKDSFRLVYHVICKMCIGSLMYDNVHEISIGTSYRFLYTRHKQNETGVIVIGQSVNMF